MASSSSSSPLVMSSYLSRSRAYLETPMYYLTWLAFYLTYLVSPGALTVLQLIAIAIDHVAPKLEYWIHHAVRPALVNSTWAQPPSRTPSPSSSASTWIDSIKRWWRPLSVPTKTVASGPTSSSQSHSRPSRQPAVPIAHAGRLGSNWQGAPSSMSPSQSVTSDREQLGQRTIVTLSNGSLESLKHGLLRERQFKALGRSRGGNGDGSSFGATTSTMAHPRTYERGGGGGARESYHSALNVGDDGFAR